MKFRPLEEHDFLFYLDWFQDHELNRRLGPLDQEWLKYVLSEQDSCQLVALENEQPVGCIGVLYPATERPGFFITDIAIHPELRGMGYGTKILIAIRNEFDETSQYSWEAVVESDNKTAIALLEKAGWSRAWQLDGDDMLGYSSTD